MVSKGRLACAGAVTVAAVLACGAPLSAGTAAAAPAWVDDLVHIIGNELKGLKGIDDPIVVARTTTSPLSQAAREEAALKRIWKGACTANKIYGFNVPERVDEYIRKNFDPDEWADVRAQLDKLKELERYDDSFGTHAVAQACRIRL